MSDPQKDRFYELIDIQKLRRQQYATDAEYQALLLSLYEDNTAWSVPEWELKQGTTDRKEEIADLMYKQGQAWRQDNRCDLCGLQLEPPKRQCAECFELEWIYFLLYSGQL